MGEEGGGGGSDGKSTTAQSGPPWLGKPGAAPAAIEHCVVWLGSLTVTCWTCNPEVTQRRRFDSNQDTTR